MTSDSIFFMILALAALGVRAVLPGSGSSALRLGRELLLFLPAALFYFLVRGLMDARFSEAAANATRIVDFERSFDIFIEPELQRLALNFSFAIDIVNWIYIWGHWPVIAAVMAWLVLRRRHAYPIYRNALLLSGVIGIAIFATFPVAPPRLLDGYDFIDTVTLHSNSYRALQPPSLTNPYAAMPSLHVGWDLLMGIALVREASGLVARAVGVLMPVAMYASTIITSNHYIVDGLAGGLLVAACLVLASTRVWAHWRRHVTSARRMAEERQVWMWAASMALIGPVQQRRSARRAARSTRGYPGRSAKTD